VNGYSTSTTAAGARSKSSAGNSPRKCCRFQRAAKAGFIEGWTQRGAPDIQRAYGAS